LAAIRAHLAAATSLRLIRIILFGLPAYRVFAEVAGEMFGTPLDGPPDCPLST
jgi:hypothetical protein